MKTRKITAITAAAAMLTALMTACGGGSSPAPSSGGSSGGGETAAPAATQAQTEAAPAADTSSGGGSITVWAPDEVTSLTQDKLNTWLAGSEFAGKWTITVSAMGEGDAATQMLTDVEAGADVFGFAQDQLSRLVSAGALSAPGGVFLDHINANNDAGSIGATTLNDKVYAYPETSDNGFFLYYDKSVVSDPSTLDSVLSSCEAAGKKFYMDIQSGWYDVAFFFATGAQCYYEYDSEGAVTGCVCDYKGDKGLAAFKAMRDMAASPAFAQPAGGEASLFGADGTVGAFVSGTWDSATISEALGENYGAAKLPTFTVDGQTYQMSGFGGFKLVGVKPQTDSDKLTFCHAVADYLTGEEMQMARFDSHGWGPSNLNAQKSDGVQSDPALAALAEQLAFCPGQGQYPQAYWDLTTAFGTDINSGKYASASDDDLLAALGELETGLKGAK